MQAATAQQGVPAKKITVFKNGTALIINEGPVPMNGKYVTLPDPGPVLLGTYWIGSVKGNSIKRVDFRTDTVKTRKDISSIPELLVANVGKKVTVSYTVGEKGDRSLTGQIISVDPGTSLVQIKKDDNRVTALQTAFIFQVEMENNASSFMKDSAVKLVSLEMENPGNEITLKEAYMQDNMNWSPSYLLRIQDDKTAYLEMKANLSNPGKAFSNVETELVVGAPILYFGLQKDPMNNHFAAETNQNEYRSKGNKNFSQLSNTQVPTGSFMKMEGVEEADEFLQNGEKQGDLYIYKLGKISIQKEATANFPIFTATIPCTEKYDCVIPEHVAAYGSSDDKGFVDVFHAYEIKNSLTMPFTTAPIMVVDNQHNFIAQNLLKYTPVGADNTIQISKAIDVTLQNKEEETNRIDNFKKVGKVTLGRVTIAGTITLNNYQKKEVTINIKKCVTGTVEPLDNGGSITKRTAEQHDRNPYSELNWQIKLKAGEAKNIHYTYQVIN
jgi:hypothetical protein